jgi:hypothetical protein
MLNRIKNDFSPFCIFAQWQFNSQQKGGKYRIPATQMTFYI